MEKVRELTPKERLFFEKILNYFIDFQRGPTNLTMMFMAFEVWDVKHEWEQRKPENKALYLDMIDSLVKKGYISAQDVFYHFKIYRDVDGNKVSMGWIREDEEGADDEE